MRDIVFSVERIDTIISAAGGLEEALAPGSIFRDALERRLLIISEAAVKLGAGAESQAPEIDWRGVRGIGNVLRHGYDQIDIETLSLVVTRELPALKAACIRLLSDNP
ncbi:HepT-like ribonuclease domain-containing protein [Maricaulaceae bacterium MS644]